MSEVSQHQEPPAAPAGCPPGGPDPSPDNKRKWDRITLGIVLGLIAVWLAAIYFHKELRAEYWAWRLTRTQDVGQRDLYVAYLSGMGHPARGPAIQPSRSPARENALDMLPVLIPRSQRSAMDAVVPPSWSMPR